MTEQNRPRHSLDSAPDPDHSSTTRGSSYPDDGYDAAYAYPGPETAAGAGAAGASGTPPVSSGPPLRGLAMILTAVAVVLILWGAFSFFSGDDDGDAGTTGAGTSTTAGAPAAGETSGGNPGEAATGNPVVSDTTPAPPASGDDGGAASDSVVVDKASARVTVLNNSTTAIAEPAADRLRESGWSGVGFGNLQGRIEGVSEASRVYYPRDDAVAKAAAEEVAGELGLQAVEGDANYYDRFGEAVVREGGRPDGGVVVVLVDPLP